MPAPTLSAVGAAPAGAPRILVAGLGDHPRLAAGLAALIRADRGAEAGVHLAELADPAAALADPPDLVVIGPGVDAGRWLNAVRRHAPAARRILVADRRDDDAGRLAKRHGALLLGQAGDGATPVAELARHCLRALAGDAETPPAKRRRGPERGSRHAEARRRAADLARALTCGELGLAYQPFVDLRSGRVLGVEALARWPHPALGPIPPNDFIPIAEATGLILDLGGWALNTAAREAASWPNQALRVSVNVSPRQIDAGVLPAQVQAALKVSNLAPSRLSIEITEGVLIETSSTTIAALAAVRAMGVAIALDDFGTGYANLATVRRLPLTALKIDRSFINGLGTAAEDALIVRAIVDLARALNLSLVAEGVETDAQRTALLGLGIIEGQGWLFGRPAPAAALGRHLKA